MGYKVHKAIEAHDLRVSAAAASAQKLIDTKSCADANAVSERISNDRQKQIDDLNRRVAADSLRPAMCVPVLAAPPASASGVPISKAGTGRLQPHGLTTTFLRSYAADYRRCQINLESCKGFVSGIYDLNEK